MKSHIFLFAASVALTALISPAIAAPMSGSEAQIKALEDKFAAAFNAKDVDAIMSFYVPDESLFVFDVGVPRQHVGAKDYRKDWEDLLGGFKGPIKFELSDLSITAEGSLGFGHSIQRVTGTDTKGKPVDFTVRVTDGYRKIKGKWLIAQEHVSVPVNFDTGKADMMSKP
ncbi:MAG TPA: nuclear transport factor 2 family protein [Rhizomicrobium sp.]